MINNIIIISGAGVIATTFGVLAGIYYRLASRIDSIYSEYVTISRNLDRLYNDLSKRIDDLYDKIFTLNKNNIKRNKKK